MLMKRITAMVHEMKCYDSVLEQKLVEVSTHHYDQMAQQLVPTASVPEYLLKVEEKLKEEVARVSYYLIEATKPKLESIIRHEMITKHMDYILENETSGFVSLVRDDKIQDLNRMYKLFCFHDEHLNKMVERYFAHIFFTIIFVDSKPILATLVKNTSMMMKSKTTPSPLSKALSIKRTSMTNF